MACKRKCLTARAWLSTAVAMRGSVPKCWTRFKVLTHGHPLCAAGALCSSLLLPCAALCFPSSWSFPGWLLCAGVQLVATAHGNVLENVIKNPDLADLVGGIATVTLGDEAARK